MSLIEILAVATSALGIWLLTRRAVIAWPITLLACFLYAEVFHQARLYSDMLLQGVYAAFCLYGWWQWQRGARQAGAVRVAPLGRRGWLYGAVAAIVGSLVLGALMARYTNAALPWLDSTLTAFSLVAQLWSTRRHLENWILWIAVDAAYTGMFLYKNLYLTAGLYAAFVVLAVIGLRSWRQALLDEPQPCAPAQA